MTKAIRGWASWVGVLLLGVVFFIGGCASQVEEPAAKVRKQAFSVNDDLTPRAMSIALPPQATLRGSVLSAATSLELAPGAQVLGGTGAGSLAISLGGRPTELGIGAKLVSLVTRPGAQLAARSTITGSIITAGPVTRDSTSTIQGTVQDHAILAPLKTYSWSVPRVAGNNISVGSDQIITLPAGTFGSVTVASRGRLKLQPGVYKFSSLFVKAGATVELPATGRVVTHIFDDWTSQGTWQSSNAENTLFVFYGDEVSLARGFVGTVVASNAQIEIGNGAFEGAFFGKEVLLASGARVHHVPFTGWDSVLPPKPFVTCVSQVGPGRFAALFGYESPLDHTVSIPVGPANSLAPAGPRSAAPITTFSPGRQERALWAQLVNGELTWSLGGQSARATPQSPSCSVEVAYPSQPDIVPRGEGPSPPLSLKRKPPPYSFESGVVPRPSLGQAVASSNHLALSALPPSAATVTGTAPFTISVTGVQYDGPIGTLEAKRLEVDTFIEDQQFGRRRLYTCNESACLGFFHLDPAVSFSKDLPLSANIVHVGFVFRQKNNYGSDDRLLFIDIVIDRATGKALSGLAGSDQSNRPAISQANLDAGCARYGVSALCWRVEPSGPPQVSGNTQVCANWTASFVDEGFGEKQGTPLGSAGLKTYPASFAEFGLRIGPTLISSGFLDENGCVAGGVPAQLLVFNEAQPLDFTFSLLAKFGKTTATDIVGYSISAPGPFAEEFTFAQATPGLPPFDQWSKVQGWQIPPQRVELANQEYTPVTNIAATISSILATPDNGIVGGAYTARYGKGCELKDSNGVVTSIDSCWDHATLNIGPATKPLDASVCRNDSDCPGAQLCYEDPGGVRVSPIPCMIGSAACSCMWPDQSRWKFVTTHEAGHQFQEIAAGSLAGDGYDFDCPPGQPDCGGERSRFNGRLLDPPFMDERCGCQHVKAANGDHCLQSIERSGDAQKEGYAQFFGSRVWNDPASPDCTFVYYKEFAQQTCLPGFDCTDFAAPNANLTLKVHLPPVPISCSPPVGGAWFKWRNEFCPMTDPRTGLQAADMGTERDWMGFLYGVNTGAGAVSMSDLHLIYRHACSPPQPGLPPAADPALCSRLRSDGVQIGVPLGWREAIAIGGMVERAGFVDGVRREFVNDPVEQARIINLGDAFGVSEKTQ